MLGQENEEAPNIQEGAYVTFVLMVTRVPVCLWEVLLSKDNKVHESHEVGRLQCIYRTEKKNLWPSATKRHKGAIVAV